jgi:dTDP-glucose pyrophosphorylase
MIIVMPMAGRGSRFAGSVYNRPKPLISVNDVPMFALALESIKGFSFSRLIIVALQEHESQYGLQQLIGKFVPYSTETVLLENVTEGQLCSVLAAEEFIDKEEDILVVSADTIILSDLARDVRQKSSLCSGLISVANMPGDRWSFARVDGNNKVVEVAEKVRISDHASTGMYYFTDGRQFCSIARQMVRKGEKTKGEYYIIPLYQKLIDQGDEVGISVAHTMWDLGTPESLQHYLRAKQRDNKD